jgi:hypothetical protein
MIETRLPNGFYDTVVSNVLTVEKDGVPEKIE